MVLVKREEIQNFYCEFFELLKKKEKCKKYSGANDFWYTT